jgi:hypothetical protein
LAVFSSNLGILRIGGKKKILAFERGFFVWSPTRLYTKTAPEPSGVLSRLSTVVVELVNIGYPPQFQMHRVSRPKKKTVSADRAPATSNPVETGPEPGARSPVGA